MKLTHEERNSPLFLKLKEHMASRLDTLRAENDKELPDDKTAKLRGRIAEIKNFLAIEQENIPLDSE